MDDLTPLPPPGDGNGAGLGTLVRQLTDDSRTLVRQEVELAKLEITSSLTGILKGSAFIALGAVLLGIGLIVLLVFVVLLLGRLLGGEYWLSTLVVGGVLALAGIATLLVGRRGLAGDGMKPDTAVESVKETGSWAAAKVRELKRDLTA